MYYDKNLIPLAEFQGHDPLQRVPTRSCRNAPVLQHLLAAEMVFVPVTALCDSCPICSAKEVHEEPGDQSSRGNLLCCSWRSQVELQETGLLQVALKSDYALPVCI